MYKATGEKAWTSKANRFVLGIWVLTVHKVNISLIKTNESVFKLELTKEHVDQKDKASAISVIVQGC